MENYYADERVLLALEKSPEELMDILTFVREVNFEIRDNLGFDVLWDSMSGKQCPLTLVHCYSSGWDTKEIRKKQLSKIL